MTSSYDVPSKYKSYVGRVFLLRKYSEIPASRCKTAGRREYFNRQDTFGETCVVLDETNAKVQVTCRDNGSLWIPKYFLHKEYQNSYLTQADCVVEFIDKIIKKSTLNKEEIEQAAHLLRAYADDLKRSQ